MQFLCRNLSLECSRLSRDADNIMKILGAILIVTHSYFINGMVEIIEVDLQKLSLLIGFNCSGQVHATNK